MDRLQPIDRLFTILYVVTTFVGTQFYIIYIIILSEQFRERKGREVLETKNLVTTTNTIKYIYIYL